MRRAHPLVAFVAVATLLAATGCGGSKHVAPIVTHPLPAGTPENTSPESTVQRLLAAYQYVDTADYDPLLAANFRYHFSGETDPALVYRYGDNWDKAHETISIQHFVHGFTDSLGNYVPPAINVTTNLVNDVVSADTAHADSAAWYQVVSVSDVVIEIDVATSAGPTTYNVTAPFVFHVVRGDAAVLAPGQSNAPTRWYVSAIDDLSPALGGAAAPGGPTNPQPAQNSTWGSIRARYYGP